MKHELESLTDYVLFRNDNRHTEIMNYNYNEIDQWSYVKCLGVYIDAKLEWHEHNIYKK